MCPLPCCVLQTGACVHVCLYVCFVDLVVTLGSLYILTSEPRLNSSTLNLFVGQFFLNRSKNLELFQIFIVCQPHRVTLQTTQNIHRQIKQTFLRVQKWFKKNPCLAAWVLLNHLDDLQKRELSASCSSNPAGDAERNKKWIKLRVIAAKKQ